MDGRLIKTERVGRTLVITMLREDKRNAINQAMTNSLDAVLNELEDDPELWVGVLSGGSRVFCAGTDIKSGSGKPSTRGGEYGIIRRHRSKPLIASVEGFAFGGGFEIALACDMIVASQTATFGFPEVKRGLIATSGALFRAPRTLPLNIAREMLLTGGEYPAARMEQIGVVNYVVDPGASLSKAIELASTITENSPVAVQQTTKVLDHIIGDNDDLGWNETKLGREIIEKSEDRAEGVSAFFERRKPNWPGR